jgi:hypothetical protein
MKTLFLFISTAFLASCAKVDSQQVKSGGIYANFAVTTDATGATNCTAVFQVGDLNGTFMSLDGGDQVTCDGKSMTKTEVLGTITYSVAVPYDLAKTYTIVFTRPNEPDYKADMTLPEPLAITWPRPGDRIGGGANGIELKWALGSTIAYDVSVQLAGPQSSTLFASEYPDKGSKLLDAKSLEMPAGSTAENFTATVTRAKAGSFPSGLAGGRSYGRQQASVTFTVTK